MKTVKYRDYQAALTALKNQFEEDGINIYDMVRTPEDPIRLGVNWAACGTVLPKDAAKFGDRLLDAAKFGDRLLDAAMAAEEFLYNGYVIDYSK